MFCRDCGTQNDDNAKFCRNCGLPIVPVEETVSTAFEEKEPAVVEATVAEETVEAVVTPTEGTPLQAEPQPGMPYGQPGPQAAYSAQGNVSKPVSASAVVSLIFGILSVVCCCTMFFAIGFGIAAICAAVMDRKKNGSSGLTTAGLVLGIVGLSLALIYLIWFFVSGEFDRLMTAIRSGNLQDYLNHIGDWNFNVYGF